MNYDEIADEITANATTLRDEVAALSKMFHDTNFLGDARNFPHAHYGYIMACMGQIDLMSKCEWGAQKEPPGNQTPRMQDFMAQYLDSQKTDVHRVAVKLFRHTLMHTGALRPIWEDDGTAYTWRVYFTDTLDPSIGHYTLTDEVVTPQDDLYKILAASNANATKYKALNVRLTDLSADILNAASKYTTALRQNPALQSNAVAIYPKLRAQRLA